MDKITGVTIIGDVYLNAGLGIALRGMVDAMKYSNIPLSYYPVHHPYAPRIKEKEMHSLEQGLLYPINLSGLNMHEFSQIQASEKLKIAAKNKYAIANWVWELPAVPEQYHTNFEYFDEIWTPSAFAKAAFATVTATPITVVPHVIEFQVNTAYNRKYFQLPENAFIFFFSFDAASSVTRKNPWAVIRAYEEAFPLHEPTRPILALKVSQLNHHPETRQKLILEMRRLKGILIEDTLSRQEMLGLLNSIDCYVSLHRAEGFGLGLAEAMYLGKPVIGTGYSGNMDFMNNANSYIADYSLKTIKSSDFESEQHLLNIYEPGSLWAEPSVDHAVELMKRVFYDANDRVKKAQNAQADIRKKLSLEAISNVISERLQVIQQLVGAGEFNKQIYRNKEAIIKNALLSLEQIQTKQKDVIEQLEYLQWRQDTFAFSKLPIAGRLIKGIVRLLLSRKIDVRQRDVDRYTYQEIAGMQEILSHFIQIHQFDD